MATKKTNNNDLLNISEEVKKGLEAISKVMGVAVIELWTIFVRQYFVRGLTMLFTAVLLISVSVIFWPYIHLFVLIPVAGAIAFLYATIIYLGNPKYYALQDVTTRIQAFTRRKEVSAPKAEVKSRASGSYISY